MSAKTLTILEWVVKECKFNVTIELNEETEQYNITLKKDGSKTVFQDHNLNYAFRIIEDYLLN